MQPEHRVPASEEEGSSSLAPPSAFKVGQRFVLNTTFAGVDHDDRRSEDSSLEIPGHSPLVKTQSIPIRNRMRRTPSELQLLEDQEMADFRDYCMFSRIVDRMSRSQREMLNRNLRYENDQCLAHVIGTRNGTADMQRELHQLNAPSQEARPPLISNNDQQARVVSMAELDTMLEVDEAEHPVDDYEDDIIFDLEL